MFLLLRFNSSSFKQLSEDYRRRKGGENGNREKYDLVSMI